MSRLHACMCIETLVKDLWMNNNRTYTHEAVLALFETSTQTSINSFSKTTKWILIIFGANWSWGRACSVSVFCFLLLFAGKHRKTLTKLKTTQKTLPVSWTSQVCRYRRDWSKVAKSKKTYRKNQNWEYGIRDIQNLPKGELPCEYEPNRSIIRVRRCISI